MPTVREILASRSIGRVQTILSSSPRRFREEIFRRFGLKQRARGSGFRLSGDSDRRAERFSEMICSSREIDDEVLAEVVRNHLYARRSLLGDSLDFFEVQHRDGLTDKDLEFLRAVDVERVGELRETLLAKGHDEDDVELYIAFMNIGAERST